ncbi:hypothetical protein OC844_007321 [Tilletia horrida]|nr:hypothetical protein OC844_007321 [Tilletia horrida]
MPTDSAPPSTPAQAHPTGPSGVDAPGTSEPFTLESLGRLMLDSNAQLSELKHSVETRLSRHDTTLTRMEARLAALETRSADAEATSATGDAATPRDASSTVRMSQPSLADMNRARQDGRHLQDHSRDRANSSSAVRFRNSGLHHPSFGGLDGDGARVSVDPYAADALGPTVPDDKFVLCKADTLGEFHGDPFTLEFFIQQVEDRARALQGRNWAKAVRAAVPEALKGTAREWHFSLSRTQVAELDTVGKYLAALRAAFPVDRVQLRRDAHDRTWKPREETATAYTFPKVRMLRQAYGEGVPEQLLVDETVAGLEPSMRALIRLPRDAHSITALREELTHSERTWRDLYKVPIVLGGSHAHPPTPLSPAKSIAAGTAPSSLSTSRVAMTAFAGAPASSARGRYDPSRVVEARGSEPRMYRRENGSYMRLGRPCGRCGEQHFDFEHAYLKEGAQAFPMVPDNDDDSELVDAVAVPATDF